MLTKKQKELFDYLDQYISKTGISPSFEEMKIAVNLKSKSGIHRLITSLEERGFIRRLKHKARAMHILKNPQDISSKNKNENNNTYIPLIGSIAAGNPIEAMNSENETIPVPSNLLSNKYKHFALYVKGESMANEGILDGDIAIIKHSKTINNGNIGVVLIKGEEVTLKKVKFQDSLVRLIPANQNYKEMTYPKSKIEIQGELKAIIRKYN